MTKKVCTSIALGVFLTLFLTINLSAQQSYNFDGEDDYIVFDYIPAYSSLEDFTFEAWINTNGLLEDVAIILSNRDLNNKGFNWGLTGDGNQFLQINNSYVEDEQSLFDGECHHIAVTRNEGVVTFFIDFQIISQHNNPTNFFSHADLYVGTDMNNLSSSFYEKIDNVRIWDFAIEEESLSYYGESCPEDFEHAILAVDFEEGNNQIIHDFSPNHNHGHLGKEYSSDIHDPAPDESCVEESCCEVNAQFQSSFTTITPNHSVQFTNNSTNFSSQEWYVDGVIKASTLHYSTSYNIEGQYLVTLKAFNENNSCYDFYSKIITVVDGINDHFCGEFEGDQPASDCPCNTTGEFDQFGNWIETTHYAYYDRFGNQYCNLAIYDPCVTTLKSTIPSHGQIAPSCTSPNGLFKIFFTDNGLSNAQKDLVCQVYADLDHLITPVSPGGGVNIEVQSYTDNTDPAAASASPYFESFGEITGVKHDEVWRAINTGFNDPLLWDGLMRINNASNYYVGYDGLTPSTAQRDMYTAILHEAVHLLGFYSLLNQNGSAILPWNMFSPFATMVTENSNDIINFTGPGLYDWNINPTVSLDQDCANTQFNGTTISPVYANSPYEGSNINHYDIDCNLGTNYVMHPSLFYNVTNSSTRRLTAPEVSTLCDLGYNITGNYGNANILFPISGNTPQTNFSINLQSFPSCGSPFAAVDDLDFALPGVNFENCIGNTYTIDVKTNDINATSSSVIDVEQIMPIPGLLYPSTNNGFDFSPQFAGNHTFRYKLLNSSGEESNYAYVTLFVRPCVVFYCSNNSPCNMICNPHMEDLDGQCNNVTFCNGFYSIGQGVSSGCNAPNGSVAISGWSPIWGTVEWHNGLATACGNLNLNMLPGDPLGEISGSNVYFTNSALSDDHGEAIMTNVDVQQGKNYIASYYYANKRTSADSDGFRVGLTQLANITWDVTYFLGIPNPNYFIHNNNGITGNAWRQNVDCFLADGNYDIFYLENKLRTVNIPAKGAKFDFVELIEDKLHDVPTDYNISCNGSQVIGLDLCSVSNMTYEWWDVSGTPVQLTDGNSIITANLPTYSVSSPNTNGSQIQINNVSAHLHLELRRVVPTTGPAPHNILINSTSCLNSSVLVDVTLTGPETASFSYSVDCDDVQFTSGTQGGSHYWEFGDGNTSTLANPVHPYLTVGTFTVLHEITIGGCLYTITEQISNEQGVCPDIVDLFDYMNEHIYPTRTYPTATTPLYYINKYGFDADLCEAPQVARPSHLGFTNGSNPNDYNPCEICWFNPSGSNYYYDSNTGFHTCDGPETNLPQWKNDNLEIRRAYFEQYHALNTAPLSEHFTDCDTPGDSYVNNSISVARTSTSGSCLDCKSFTLMWLDIGITNTWGNTFVNGSSIGYTGVTFWQHNLDYVIEGIISVDNLRVDCSISNYYPSIDIACAHSRYTNIIADITKENGTIVQGALFLSDNVGFKTAQEAVECANMEFTSNSYPIPSDCIYPDADFTTVVTGMNVAFTSNDQTGIHYWDFGDGNTSTSVNPTHLYSLNPGPYPQIIHQVTNAQGCLKSKYGFALEHGPPGTIQVFKSLGNEGEDIVGMQSDNIYEQQILLYPNPARNILNIHAPNKQDEMISYKLFDSYGQIIFQEKRPTQRFKIDVSDLSVGTYIVEVQTRTGVVVQKFVKE